MTLFLQRVIKFDLLRKAVALTPSSRHPPSDPNSCSASHEIPLCFSKQIQSPYFKHFHLQSLSPFFSSSQIIINLPFLISRYYYFYYLCIYIWVNFAFKAMFLSSSGTRESFILLAASIQAFGRKQRQQNDREKWISWTNVTWVLFPFFHFQHSRLRLRLHPLPPPPNTHTHTHFLLLLWVYLHCRRLSRKMLFKVPAELDGCP